MGGILLIISKYLVDQLILAPLSILVLLLHNTVNLSAEHILELSLKRMAVLSQKSLQIS